MVDALKLDPYKREIVGKGMNRKSSPCTFKASSHKSEPRERVMKSWAEEECPCQALQMLSPDAAQFFPPCPSLQTERKRKSRRECEYESEQVEKCFSFWTNSKLLLLKSSHISLKKGHGCIIVFTITKVLCLCLCEIQSIFILFQTTSLCSSDNAPQSSPQMK